MSAFAMVVCASVLTSCAKQPDRIVLAESSLSVPDALSFIARKKGFWQEQGLDVQVLSFTAGKPALDAMLSGQAQFAFTGETPIAVAAFRYHDFGVLAQISTSHELAIVARRSAGIQSIKDLAGRKVAIFKGTQSDYFLYRSLKAAGMATDSVQTLSMQPPDMVRAMAGRDVDAASIWQPHSLRIADQLDADGIVLPSDGTYSAIVSLVASRDYVSKNPDIARRFLKGLIEAEQFAKAHPAEAADIIAQQVRIDNKMLARFLPKYDFTVRLSPDLVAELQSEADWASAVGFAPAGQKAPDYNTYMLTEPLRGIATERVGAFK